MPVGRASLCVALVGCSGRLVRRPTGPDDVQRVDLRVAGRPARADSLLVPDGVELTEQGSSLDVGETATVAYEVRQGVVGVLDITVTRLEKTSFEESFVGWDLDAEDEDRQALLRARDASPTAARPTSAADRCRSTSSTAPTPWSRRPRSRARSSRAEPGSFPEPFPPGATRELCLVYLAPDKGDLTAVELPADRGRHPDHLDRRGQEAEAAEGRQGQGQGRSRQELGRGRRAMAGCPPPAQHPGLTLGPLHVATPVVLAPMAGITNAAYRRLCAEQGAGLYVCEMITSRGIVERDAVTLGMLVFDELETVRSVQLYGTDPVYVGKAAEILCAEYGVRHIDLNFGCPVPKVTRKGGGGALPWKRGLLGRILESAVAAAAPYDVPVTMKTRKGIDDDHLTYLDAGRIAQEAGCAAIALHGRTVAQSYSGRADWDAIARAGRRTSTSRCSATATSGRPRTRCGWSRRPARPASSSAVAASGGRGCSATWPRRSPGSRWRPCPTLGEVAAMMRRHAELLVQHLGEERGCKEFRKHVSWYLKGFAAGGELRRSLALISTLARARRACWPSSTPTSRSRPASWVAARPPGLAARQGRAARGVAPRHRRGGRAHVRGRDGGHRRVRPNCE